MNRWQPRTGPSVHGTRADRASLGLDWQTQITQYLGSPAYSKSFYWPQVFVCMCVWGWDAGGCNDLRSVLVSEKKRRKKKHKEKSTFKNQSLFYYYSHFVLYWHYESKHCSFMLYLKMFNIYFSVNYY